MNIFSELKYYKVLSEKWPTKKDAVSEIINLQAILSLPKGTEHFISDIHGEYVHFNHIMRTASGVIRAKIHDVYKDILSEEDEIKLANLIYYPEKVLKDSGKNKEWMTVNLLRLIEICKIVCGKYTRSKVKKALPEKYSYVIDELLNCSLDNVNKENYYAKIIESITDLGCAEDFLIEIAGLIRRLSVDHLHIVGDIFDRGPRPDIVLDILSEVKQIDIQWGNHDVVWMGAMMGSAVCISVVLANSLKYKNTLFLEEGYGISLRKLEHFADRFYSGKSHTERMYKAISVIRFKLEDEVIKKNPDFLMSDMTKLDKIDFNYMSWCGFELNTDEFPTVNPDKPSELTVEEMEIIKELKRNFTSSEKMQKHLNFLFSKGSIYLCFNGNLLYHGCVPIYENGNFSSFFWKGKSYSGKRYMDFCEKNLRAAYKEKSKSSPDFAWFLWCAPDSPLFGKKKMATFERMYIDDKTTHVEEKQPYFRLWDDKELCNKILSEFGLDVEEGHIINGHIPVRFKDGESPVKANGKLILIDGGMSDTYRKQTGIAGYTLTFNSYGLAITSHSPFESVFDIIDKNHEMLSQKFIVEKVKKRILIEDTDKGRELSENIKDLKNLIFLYDNGIIAQN